MRILLLAGIIAAFSLNAFSTVRTWDGGGADANWSTPANWVGDVAPQTNDDLVFPAVATQFTANNNMVFLSNFNSITIDGTYTLSGNAFRIGAGGLIITSGTQTINTTVQLSAASTITVNDAASTATIVAVSNGSFGLTFDGPGIAGVGLISGTGPITKNGTGAAAFISSFGFSGSIAINNGIFVVDASIPSSAVTVNSAATGGTFGISGLGGTGTVGAVNVVQGGISAGTLTSPTGILNISGGLTFTANGAYVCKIGGTTPGANGYDQLNVTGAVNLANARLGPLPWNAFRPAVGDSFTILKNDGSDPVVGTFLNAPEGSVFSGPLNTAFRITYHGGDGNDIVVTTVARAPFDFDGDGKTDVATFRPPDGTWNVIPSGGGATQSSHWGLGTDAIAPADYDGDNRADLAVYRGSEGVWYILNSFTSTATIVQFGVNGDRPRPNDFDGDGRADIAVFRPSNGTWYEMRSLTNQPFAQQFGITGDIPLMVDFDGDGMGDLSVYRPADGTWHFWQSSTNSYFAFPFGLSSDIPVPGDFNGDGRTDAAIFRPTADPNQPDFYILLSGPFTTLGSSWGVPGDIPVVADYDGDGKSDVGVFRPSTNIWYLLGSTAGFTQVPFGSNADRAIPSAYITITAVIGP